MKIRKRDQKREKSGGQKGKKKMQSWQWIHDHTSRPRMNLRGSIQRVDPDEKLGCFGNQIYGPGVTYQRLIYYHLRLYINRSVITIDAPAWQLQQHFFFPSKESAGIFLEILYFTKPCWLFVDPWKFVQILGDSLELFCIKIWLQI